MAKQQLLEGADRRVLQTEGKLHLTLSELVAGAGCGASSLGFCQNFARAGWIVHGK